MYLEDGLSAQHVRPSDDHAAIEASRPQQRRIEHIGSVGRRHQDYAFIRFEAVHLDE